MTPVPRSPKRSVPPSVPSPFSSVASRLCFLLQTPRVFSTRLLKPLAPAYRARVSSMVTIGRQRGDVMAARCPRGLWLMVLFTSLLTVLPPPLSAQAVRYEYDALGGFTLGSTPAGPVIGASGFPIYSSLSLKPRTILSTWFSPRTILGPGPSLGMAGYSGRASRASSDGGSRV